MFFFKRFVGALINPLPVVFFFLALALFLWRRGRPRCGWYSLAVGVAVLLLSTFPYPVRRLARSLEGRYRPVAAGSPSPDAPAAIVILGNGVEHPGDRLLPALTRLNDTARARLVEGVRLARIFPEAEMITCGNGLGLENCADAMAEAAVELGVEPVRIRRVVQGRDTGHEAELVKSAVGDAPVLLVTTAVHMERSMAEFRRRGVNAVPAPCDFVAPASDDALGAVDRSRWRPRGGNIVANEKTWHELAGLLYLRWFGEGADDGRRGGQ